jgi:class 3 adenylate cyclase/tetratricopeptide (TPR) repeat protein
MRDARIETATVLFTDLVDSTVLRTSLGEERADQLRRVHDTLVTDAVVANLGRVIKSLGDGFMAVFTSATSAIQAAVAIQQAFDKRNRQVTIDPPVHVRIGLAAGDVRFEGDDCFGITVVHAARLCALCTSDEIVGTTTVKSLAGTRVGFPFVSLGALQLKGIDEPVDGFRIDWPRPESAVWSLPVEGFLDGAGGVTLRGRAQERLKLAALWDKTRAGTPQIALICGEPGIGKTRLVTEMAHDVMRQADIVLAGRVEEGLGGPYQPYVEAILHYVRHLGEAVTPDALGDAPGELTRIVPELTTLVGPLPDPVKADPGAEQYRLADSITSFVRTVSDSAPVLFFIDDFHWCEPQAALLLRHLCTHLGHSNVLVAVTYRETDLRANPTAAAVIADLFRIPGVQLFDLEGVDHKAVLDLMVDAGLEADGSANELADQIHRHAEGNPFFVNELIRHVRDSGDSTLADRVPRLPTSVTEVVHRRVNRLRPAVVEMLQYAAVAGRDFTLKLLGPLLGDGEPLVDYADEAVAARLLEEVGIGRYRFVHQIVTETLLADLSVTRRADVHLRIAAAIERDNASDLDAVIGDLAFHYSSAAPAGDQDRAVDIITRAGHKAFRQLAFVEAASHYERALQLAPSGPNRTRIDLLVALARARSHAGQPDPSLSVEAATLARELGDDARFAESVLADDVAVLGVFGAVDTGRTALLEEAIQRGDELPASTRARLHADLALELAFADTLDRRLSLANRALELARESQSLEVLGRTLALRYPTLWTAQTLEERSRIVEELTSIADQLGDRFLGFLAAANGALVMLEAGEIASARERIEIAEDRSEQLGEPRLRWFASICRAKHQILTGELDLAEETVKRGAELGARAGRADAANYLAAQTFCIGFHRGSLGGLEQSVDEAIERSRGRVSFRSMRVALEAELGATPGARTDLEDLARTEFAFPADFTQVVAWCFCSLGAAATGDVDAARSLYNRLLPYQGRYADAGSTWYGAVDHYLGGLAAVLGRRDDALSYYRAAERSHARVGSPPMMERTRRAFARLTER